MAPSSSETLHKSSVNRDRFIRIAEKRVNKLLAAFDTLGNCSNRKNYEYGQDDIKKVFSAIEKKMQETRARFQEQSREKTAFRFR